MSAPLRLRTALGPYPHVRELRDSERVVFDFVEVTPITRTFRRMARDLEFDLCEMATVTLAQAHAYGKPIVGLSAVVTRGFHHSALICLCDSDLRGPEELVGKRVGVRAYSQTTGVWVRGILQSDYGIDPPSMTWVTEEDAHVAEYRDPPFVIRAPAGRDLFDMLRAGEIDAVVTLQKADPAVMRTVIPDADAVAADWFRRTGVHPVNHVITVRREKLTAHPWLADELMRLFAAAKAAARSPATTDDALPYGLEANRVAIELLTRFAAEQGLIPRAYAADELFVA
jgi:4,5-dihydroxyphthalate decarboxylase